MKTGMGSWGLRPRVRTDARLPAGRALLLPEGSRYSEARGGVLKGHRCGGGEGRAQPPSGQDAALHCGGPGPVPGPGTEAPQPRGRVYTGAFMNRSAEALLIHTPGLWHTAHEAGIYTSHYFHHRRTLTSALRAGTPAVQQGLGAASADGAQGVSMSWLLQTALQ